MTAVPQSQFRAALLDAGVAVPEGIVNPDRGPATKRFDVYRNNVAVGLSDALEAGFPVLRKLLGADFFRAMAGVYLRTHPPQSPLMMYYGAAMPQFLARFGPTAKLGYLPDVARLELALREAYHAADATPIAPAELAAVHGDALMRARLRLAPAVRTLSSDHPVHAIYLANTAVSAPKPVMRAEAVLVSRAGLDPQIHPIGAAGAACITALGQGRSLGHAFADADETLDLGAVLTLLLAQGAITEIY